MKSVVAIKDRSGDNPELTLHVMTMLRSLGHYGPLILRSDGEPALQDLLARVATARETRTVVERSSREDSKANGRAERAVRAVEEMVRVLKCDLK